MIPGIRITANEAFNGFTRKIKRLDGTIFEFSLDKIKFLVLDEADRLLEDNFGKQLQTIFSILPKQRQTLLFSATITDTIKQVQSIS